jgi:putative aldouronate transport system permease protein
MDSLRRTVKYSLEKPRHAAPNGSSDMGILQKADGRIRFGSRYLRANFALYLMLLPGLFFLVIYKFLPLYGITMAFKDYNIFLGGNPMQAIGLSPWVGLKHFDRLFNSAAFLTVLSNTLIINALKIVILFPIPIACAILLNEIRFMPYRRVAQTAIYVPYFFSWVIVFGIFYSILGSYGIVNEARNRMGLETMNYFSNKNVFRGVLIFTEGWKEIGWNTIIYLAAITAIDPTLYEAAIVDGAGKTRQIRHITIPGLFPTIVLMLILKIGYILDTGFEQILVMYNPAVYEVADVIQTYVYRMGLGQMDFSLGTALGLFNSVVAFVLIVGANAVSRRLLHRSIW